jgi:hypothetical protein
MGFSTIIDIIGSTFIGGILLLMMIRTNATLIENKFSSNNDKMVQSYVTTLAQIIEYDFNRIGYCEDEKLMVTRANTQQPNITLAERRKISFLTDLPVNFSTGRGDGVLETITYSIVPTNIYPNPKIKLFLRNVTGEPPDNGANMDVTDFEIRYFTVNNTELTPPVAAALLPQINKLEINLKFEDPYGYDSKRKLEAAITKQDSSGVFETSFWQQIKLSSLNKVN